MTKDKRMNAARRARARSRSQAATVPESGSNPVVVKERPQDPVVGIHVVPKGPRHLFVDARGRDTQTQCITIGAARDCDIQLHDPTISARHCMVVRRGSRVYVEDLGSTNGVWIAGGRVPWCELYPGTLFTIGSISIAAIGQEGADRDIVVAAATVPELFRKAVEAYGSIRAAADGLGVPYSTLRKWLQNE